MSEQVWYSVGVDVGGTTTRAVLFGGDGDVLHEALTATPHGPEACVANIAEQVAAVSRGHAVRHVGVGIPGRVTSAGEVSHALNVGIDTPVDVAGALRARLGVQVAVENDVNAAAVGAIAEIGGRGLTFLSIGTGIAAGTVLDREIVRGATGVAGEIGHVPLPGDTTPCVCGQTGCIEALASGQALSTAAQSLGLGQSAGRATAIDLWDAADAGHAEALRARARAVDALAFAAQMIVLLLDVDHVVLGGGVAALGARLVDPVRARLAEREAASPWLASVGPSRRLRLAPAGVHLGAVGADLAARERLAGGPGALHG